VKRLALALAAFCLLGACGKGHGGAQSEAGGSKWGLPNLMSLHAGPPPIPTSCDARSLTWLVGKPRTQIPVAADLTKRRVACTTCPTASDVQADRTDILFDAGTGRVTQVTCG
jgi:hypothetical protein